MFRGFARTSASYVVVSLLAGAPTLGFCFDEAKRTKEAPLIEAYEPNILGYTWQDDDVGFIDVNLSLKYRLLPEHISAWACSKPDRCDERWKAYLAFTGRFGFYLGTRDSDPVISKSFNPKLLIRYTPDSARNTAAYWRKGDREISEDWSYIDFAYAHESNGQSIDNGDLFRVEQRLNRAHPDFSLDKISRGWDYLQVAGKYSFRTNSEDSRVRAYVDLKFFLRDGPIQDVPEEFFSDFEAPRDIQRRSEVQGIKAAIEYELPESPSSKLGNGPLFSQPRLMFQYETGYDPVFRFDTARIELGVKFIELPIAFWYQDGYGSSLARYYKKSSAFGIELRIAE